jgi:hypothetical protein
MAARLVMEMDEVGRRGYLAHSDRQRSARPPSDMAVIEYQNHIKTTFLW